MRIGIIGVGYVGLITALGLYKLGHQIWLHDKDISKLELISRGKLPFFEPGAEEVLTDALNMKAISFTVSLQDMIANTEATMICVGTPSGERRPDLRQISKATLELAEALREVEPDKYLIVQRSTAPVGTYRMIEKVIRRDYKGELLLAVNPEFLREGYALEEFLNPYRVVIGVESELAGQMMLDIYSGISAPKLIMRPEEAELIKYAANSFLAMKISFINLIADLCDKVDARISVVSHALGLDPRIGEHFLRAGIGYGGSCLPKDVEALIWQLENYNINPSLIQAVQEINSSRIKKVIELLLEELWTLEGKKIAIWGLAFKPNTDDVRDSPAIELARSLLDLGAQLSLHDPRAIERFKSVIPPSSRVAYLSEPLEAVDSAHALILVTDWDEYKSISAESVAERMRWRIIIDGRNVLDPVKYCKAGFTYISLGNGKFKPTGEQQKLRM